MVAGGVSVRRYSRLALHRLVGDGTAQQYLAGYLRELGVQSFVVESHYVDRHYLADYSAYYSRSFDAPPAHCRRAHFFSIPARAIQRLFARAYRSNKARIAAEQGLQESYLGFVVVRPLPKAPIGRAVLRTYPPHGARRYEVVRPYSVNLAGLRIEINGLAFQQQDQGAAVCASTALWSALQRVAYVAGHRTPTPTAITAAAASPFPASHGLNDMQMATALARLGYIAEQFSPSVDRALFRAKVVACLDSQLPVVLVIEKTRKTETGNVRVSHAVTITGYKQGAEAVIVGVRTELEASIPLATAGTSVYYVHDDNLGSHAHYEFVDSDCEDDQGCKMLLLQRGDLGRKRASYWDVDEWEIVLALVPKPEKMRLSIEALFLDIAELSLLFAAVFDGLAVSYSVRFESGVNYKRSLFTGRTTANSLRDFQQQASLPRHVGVIAVRRGEFVLCECVLDVSEVPREALRPNVVALVAANVPANSIAGESLIAVAARLRCSILLGKPLPNSAASQRSRRQTKAKEAS